MTHWLREKAFSIGGAIILLLLVGGFVLQTYTAINTNKVVHFHSGQSADIKSIVSAIAAVQKIDAPKVKATAQADAELSAFAGWLTLSQIVDYQCSHGPVCPPLPKLPPILLETLYGPAAKG